MSVAAAVVAVTAVYNIHGAGKDDGGGSGLFPSVENDSK